jgi:hypothetical protein
MKMLRLPVLLAALSAFAGALALHAAPGNASDGNAFDAAFTESNASVTNRIPDLGVFQLINTGTGTMNGFGAATMVLGVTQDRSVHPCGVGSWTNAGTRRIVVDAGVLVLRSFAYVCQTAAGPVATETWTVDGASSTGVFADARGDGQGTVDIRTGASTLSGKLKLAGANDA